VRLLLLLGPRRLPDQVACSADAQFLIAGLAVRRVALGVPRAAAIKVSGRAAVTRAQERPGAATREPVEQQVPGARDAPCIRRVLRQPVAPGARLALGLVMPGLGVADLVSVHRGLVLARVRAERPVLVDLRRWAKRLDRSGRAGPRVAGVSSIQRAKKAR
jgi:hypothetical protein